jgi:hypothetical protein
MELKTEKEVLEETMKYLETIGKKAKELIPADQKKFLSRYNIGSIETLRRFYKFKKEQLEKLGG